MHKSGGGGDKITRGEAIVVVVTTVGRELLVVISCTGQLGIIGRLWKGTKERKRE